MKYPGILYVTMEPKPELPDEQFHEWYNNEHGPTRLRMPHIFTNGLRYRAIDKKQPSFLASYDITSMPLLETETYTRLRASRSPREADTIAQIDVTRYFWDLIAIRQDRLPMSIEQFTDDEAEGLVLVAAELAPKDAAAAAAADSVVEDEIHKWFEEHSDMLSRVPGWLQSRLFRTSHLETGKTRSYLMLTDYAKENGISGDEYRAAIASPTTQNIFSKHIRTVSKRKYSLFYVFGPAPRDLTNLAQLEPAKSRFQSSDLHTTTSNDDGAGPVIQSHITTADSLSIPYRLEGNPDPQAPVIAFCNSLLTSLHMWDAFVAILRAERPQYRVLRYDARGRGALPEPPTPATMEAHASDLAQLLAALRVPRLAALVGVSMGGATALRFALTHPEKLGTLIACDFNAVSSSANTEAWKARIAVAETPLENGTPGIARLAGQTVERWFHPSTMQGKPEIARWMEGMVAANDVQGFRYGCQALWDYDMREEMRGCRVPALLVAGEGDGKGALVKAMDGFRGGLGPDGTELAVVPDAGHLPMCENPQGFWEVVKKQL